MNRTYRAGDRRLRGLAFSAGHPASFVPNVRQGSMLSTAGSPKCFKPSKGHPDRTLIEGMAPGPLHQSGNPCEDAFSGRPIIQSAPKAD